MQEIRSASSRSSSTAWHTLSTEWTAFTGSWLRMSWSISA